MPRRVAAMLAAVEPAENSGALLRRNAATGVADARKRAAVRCPGLNPDGAARRGELDRIVDQIRDRLAHEVLIAANRDGFAGVDVHRNEFGFGERLIEVEHLAADGAEVKFCQLRFPSTMFNSRDPQYSRDRR